MYLQVPHRLFPDERPSVARLVQLVLCDDGWARIDAYRMAYEHIHGIKLDEREAEAHIRQKASIQQRLMSFHDSRSSVHDFRIPPAAGPAGFDQPVNNGGINYPLSDKFASISLGNGGLTHQGSSVDTPKKSPVQRPRMERASTSTSGVSVVVPCNVPTADIAEGTRKDSLATLSSSSSDHPRVGPLEQQDSEFKHWGRLDDPESVWNNLHVERPKLSGRRRFSSYKEYKKTRNQPMKDNDRLFKKRVKQSFAKGEIEVLGVDGHEDGDEDGEEEDGELEGSERRSVVQAEPKRQILLVKRKGNLAGQNL